MTQQLVVIGNGMAGMKAVEELLAAAPEKFSITVFGAEPYGNYNRIMLSPVLCGEKSIEDIIINDRQWYQDNHITLHAGPDKAVVDIDRQRKVVTAKDGTEAHYDRLLIATGSNPFILPIPGNDLEGVIAFRDIYDVNKMLSYSETKQHAVVLGGGLLGLEAANGLAQRGMHVTVVHSNEVLLNRQLDGTAGHLLQLELEKRGVHFKMPAKTQALIDNGEGHVSGVQFADGSELTCDLFVMAIGVRPNMKLAESAGIHCERGIVVSDTLQTYDPSVYAVGECIQHRGDTFGLVAPLFEQAKVCANHLSGHGVAEYKTLPSATKLKVTGINLFSLGDFLGDEECEIIRFSDPSASVYKKLVIKNHCIVGVVLYGDTKDGAWYQSLLEQRTNIEDMRELLIFGQAYFQTELVQTELAGEVG
ncbi:NAD(P)/FAD-dependent oxidoreductase [Litoribacillus peritrichatus]|uniref:NAD(P)/FAD-dependent oxidoreductase n=1 Tax=Litoribacillus peritrichatus TaxID=718191 RepID=A0ABP7N857_9GAMM